MKDFTDKVGPTSNIILVEVVLSQVQKWDRNGGKDEGAGGFCIRSDYRAKTSF